MLVLNDSQLVGDDKLPEIASYDKTEDPPVANLRTWTVINMRSVFNKWLTKSPSNGFDVPNNNQCQFVYNKDMPEKVFSVKIAGANYIPDKWTRTPVAATTATP